MCIWGERGPRAASQLCICLCQGSSSTTLRKVVTKRSIFYTRRLEFLSFSSELIRLVRDSSIDVGVQVCLNLRCAEL